MPTSLTGAAGRAAVCGADRRYASSTSHTRVTARSVRTTAHTFIAIGARQWPRTSGVSNAVYSAVVWGQGFQNGGADGVVNDVPPRAIILTTKHFRSLDFNALVG